MQFYILHKDCWKNAELLPDYCLKKVNIREGYQILSDCGHAVDLKWSTQNKEYNRYHPNTWRYWKNTTAFYDFVDHYIACLCEYKKRFGEEKTYITYRNKLRGFIYEALPYLAKYVKNYTEEQHIARYLVDRKEQHLNSKDCRNLFFIIEGYNG